ncbi:MAG: D-alanyl-D-alanine carboxypeptidase, partial [Flavisolibacter sp.]
MKAFLFLTALALFCSCSSSRNIRRTAAHTVESDAALKQAHVGISIYEPATGKFLFDHQGEKYFVPASNTKLATCFAAMKYLGDSLVGLKLTEYKNDLVLTGTADP